MPRRPAAAAIGITDVADVYPALLRLVVRGELAPGLRLSEATLAARLGVSRTPVRAALQRLLLEGLVVVEGGGARPRVAVAPLDPAEAREIYRAVGLLEGAAARAVAAWPTASRRALAAALRRLDAEFRAASSADPPRADALFASHEAFHAALTDATADRVARLLLATLRPRRQRYEWFHGPLLQLSGVAFTPTLDEHAAIIAAVARGTAAELERTVRTNWEQAAQRLSHALERAHQVMAPAAGPRPSAHPPSVATRRAR